MYILGILWIVFYFHPQLSDVYHHSVVRYVKIGLVPYRFVKVLSGKYPAGVFHHQQEHPVLYFGKLYFSAVTEYFIVRRADFQ